MIRSVQNNSFPRLEEFRQAKNLRDTDLADLLGVSVRTLSRWRGGETSVTMAVAQRVFVQTEGFIRILDWPTEYTLENQIIVDEILSKRAGEGEEPTGPERVRKKPRKIIKPKAKNMKGKAP